MSRAGVTTPPTLWAWSPTEARLAVIRPSTDGYGLILIDPSTGRETDLVDTLRGATLVEGVGSSVMAWSPEGTRIAYGTDERWVYSVDVKSGDLSLLARLPSNEKEPWIAGIEWSPDGEHLAIVDGGGGPAAANSSLYLAEGDGSHLRLIDESIAGGVVIPPHSDSSDEIAWSPDGTRLAYVDYGGPDANELQIWTVRLTARPVPWSGSTSARVAPGQPNAGRGPPPRQTPAVASYGHPTGRRSRPTSSSIISS